MIIKTSIPSPSVLVEVPRSYQIGKKNIKNAPYIAKIVVGQTQKFEFGQQKANPY